AAAGDLWIGRLTFALGVTCAVGAGLAHLHGRRLAGAVPGAPGAGSRARAPVRARRAAWRALAGCAAVLAAATSPVAGLILALAAASWALGDALAGSPARAVRAHLAGALAPRLREVAPLLGGPVITVLAMQALFPEGGFEPYAASSLAAALAVTLAFILALPRDERVLRTAAWIYVPVNLLCEIPTAMGSNVQRYGILLAGPLLLGVLAQGRTSRAGRPLLVALLAGMATWVVWGPIVQTAEVIGEPSTRSAYYAPVERFLVRASAAGPIRVEVPFTRAHWEAALLAPSVPLARGWERQLDKRYNLSLESSTLTAAQYRSWLDRYGVRFVALPDAPLDQSSFAEARLIRSGLPYLREIFRNVHWRVFEVLGAAPLAVRLAGAGRGGAAAVAKQPRLLALTHTGFRLYASGPGRYLVKVHYTPYWQVIAGRGTVHSGPGGFTEVDAGGSGELAVRARFSLGGAWGALAMALEVL
ncbi:MAG: hypothetical protein KGJ43_01635, partial [Acidobacteriota bacterium]|nr:hypothetical protein [Acidobacteriota bacterium]